MSETQTGYKHFFERTMDAKDSKGIVFASDSKDVEYEEYTTHDATQQSPVAKFHRKINVKNSKGIWWGLKDEDKDGKFTYHESIKFSNE